MRDAAYFKHGKPKDVLRPVDVDDPKRPERGEGIVRVLLRPIHHGDLLGVAGRYQPGSTVLEGGARVAFEGYSILRR